MRSSSLALFALVGCIDGGPVDGEPTLEISPSEFRVTIEDGAPVVHDVTVTLVNANGTRTDVTGRAKLALDAAFGSAHDDGIELTGASVGPTRVTATLGEWSASAPVLVSSRTSHFAPDVTKAMRAVFDAASERTGCGLAIAYPSRESVIPRSAGAFDVAWNDESHDMFEVQLATAYRDVRFYTSDANAAIAATDWQSIIDAKDRIDLRVRGIVRADAKEACAYSQSVRVSDQPMRGAIYLWGDGTGIVRQDASSPTTEMTGIYIAAPTTTLYQTTVRDFPLTCTGCALSKNGARLAVSSTELGYGMIYDFVNHVRMVPSENERWDSAAFMPDDSRLVIAQDGALHLITDLGQRLATFASETADSSPAISPDGKWLAYVADGSRLVLRPISPRVTDTFTVAPPQTNAALSAPSWSPDGEWLAYTRTTYGMQSLWVVRADGSQPAQQITSLSHDPVVAHWSPTAQTSDGESFTYLAYSSTAFGPSQIVVRAFFPKRATFAPAVRLPFQSADAPHYLAGWASAMVR